jgi:hypothetical protein
MTRRFSSVTIALAALLAAWNLDVDATRQAQAAHHYRTGPELFYNYYVPPGGAPSGSGGVPAQLYLSPRPTPPLVGHTYVTYQPLMPHEFLYGHCRRYWRYDPAEGRWTRTQVIWQRTCFDLDFLGFPSSR